LEKVRAVSRFIKKSNGCPMILAFFGYLRIVFYRKSHGSGLWITGPQLALSPWWTHDHRAARPLRGSRGRRGSSEREREERLSRFPPMTPLGAKATEMATQWCSTEAVGGAPMRRWFQA
jgi:hypothetical protein